MFCKFLKTFAGPPGVFVSGKSYAVSDDFAKSVVGSGIAIEVDEDGNAIEKPKAKSDPKSDPKSKGE